MKIAWRHIIFTLGVFLIILGGNDLSAQKTDAFARVSVSPREGVVRQPYKVTITVHSSTWFARPLQFANLQIDNAFIIPFTRTVSSINYINNKKYATLSFYYLVFPYSTGTIQIPELEINASIPPEGAYKGEPLTIRTKAQNIKVEPVPSSKNENVWMVAKNVSLKESWDRPLDHLKVGDVIERKITISANGTLPSLIQPFEIEKPDFTSIYPKEPELQDKRNNVDANGIRIEKYAYLFEEEGEVIIPEEEILWWNPDTKRVYKRTISEKKLSIVANADLAMMESLKDSLMAMSVPLELEEKVKTFPWLRIGSIVFVLLVLAYFGTIIIRSLLQKATVKRAAYLQSEAYYYKKLIQALNQKTSTEFIRELYRWFDKARSEKQDASIYSFLDLEEKKLMESVLRKEASELSLEQKKEMGFMLVNLREHIIYPEINGNIELKINPI